MCVGGCGGDLEAGRSGISGVATVTVTGPFIPFRGQRRRPVTRSDDYPHSSAELPSLISPHEVVGSRTTCDPVATALAEDWVTMSLLFAQW